jgi:inorganic pyrophosphatase
MTQYFWSTLEELSKRHQLVIDRPRGTSHPRYPNLVYPLDYGYLEGTSSQDGGGVDVWRGSQLQIGISAVAVTIDCWKKDTEIKILCGCTEAEQERVLRLHSEVSMRCLLVTRGGQVKALSVPPTAASSACCFWQMADAFAAVHAVAIDPPARQDAPQPACGCRYGQLKGTAVAGGRPIDVWVGGGALDRVTALCLIADWQRSQCEVKLLLGCTDVEIGAIGRIHDHGLIVRRSAYD